MGPRERTGARLVGAFLLLSIAVTAWSVGVAPAPVASAATTPVAGIDQVAVGLDHPDAMAPGPDGDVWFTSSANDTLGHVTPAGHVDLLSRSWIDDPSALAPGTDGNVWFANRSGTVVAVDSTGADVSWSYVSEEARLEGIAAGPDGNMWVTDAAGEQLARVVPDDLAVTFPVGVAPHDLASGPDGNLWFTAPADDVVGRMTTSGTVTTFSGPAVNGPTSIVAGPDGNLWFANDDGTVGRMSTSGVAAAFPAVPMYRVNDLTVGPDGNLWFATQATATIGRMTTAGSSTLFTGPGTSSPTAIASGADGRLWFTEGYSVGAATTAATFTSYAGPAISAPRGITAGPDGKMWFTNRESDSIGRLEPDGSVTSFTSPLVDGPERIVAGADGNLWFTNLAGSSIGRITPTGTISRFSVAGLAGPVGIAAGPDGNVWFTDVVANRIGRITPSGVIATFTSPSIKGPKAIVAGPDGNLWFTSSTGASIGRITTAGVVTSFADPAHVHQPSGIGVGPDGRLWFVDGTDIGAITTAGVLSTVGPSQGFGDGDLVAGPDGGAWVVQGGDAVQRVTFTGQTHGYAYAAIDQPVAATVGPDGNVWIANLTSSIARVRITRSVPDAPSTVTATADYRSAVVTWQPPTFTGGSPVTGYTVYVNGEWAKPRCVNTSAMTCQVDGLTAELGYSFTVVAHNALGTSPVTWSNPIAVFVGATFHPLPPHRVLDSRGPPTSGGWSGRLAAGAPRSLDLVTITGQVPFYATAVVMNVTATDSDAATFLTVSPTGAPTPNASNLNVGPGRDVANLVTVPLGPGGVVDIATAVGSTHVVADVVGYYDEGHGGGGLFTPVAPRRLLDSRGPVGGWSAKLGEGRPQDLTVAQPGNPNGVPASATAVVANVTVTQADAQSLLRIYPYGQGIPVVSNVNFLPGQTVANLVVMGIGWDGKISFSNEVGSVHVVVDVVGYFDPTAGSAFFPLSPRRVLDSRFGNGLAGPWQPGQSRSLAVGGRPGTGVAAEATGVVANVTVTDGTAESLLTVYPGDVVRPNASNLNFAAGQIVPNLVTVGLAPDGSLQIFNDRGTVNVVADVVGFYAPR